MPKQTPSPLVASFHENPTFHDLLTYIDNGLGKLIVAGAMAHNSKTTFSAGSMAQYLSGYQKPEDTWQISKQFIDLYRTTSFASAGILQETDTTPMRLDLASVYHLSCHSGALLDWQLTHSTPYIGDALGNSIMSDAQGVGTSYRRYALLTTLVRRDDPQLSTADAVRMQRSEFHAQSISTTGHLWTLVGAGILDGTYDDVSRLTSVAMKPPIKPAIADLIDRLDNLRTRRHTPEYQAAANQIFESETMLRSLIRTAGSYAIRHEGPAMTKVNVVRAAQELETFNVYELMRFFMQGSRTLSPGSIREAIKKLATQGKLQQIASDTKQPSRYKLAPQISDKSAPYIGYA